MVEEDIALLLIAAAVWAFLVYRAMRWQGQPWWLKGIRLVAIPLAVAGGFLPGMTRGMEALLVLTAIGLLAVGGIVDGVWRSGYFDVTPRRTGRSGRHGSPKKVSRNPGKNREISEPPAGGARDEGRPVAPQHRQGEATRRGRDRKEVGTQGAELQRSADEDC